MNTADELGVRPSVASAATDQESTATETTARVGATSVGRVGVRGHRRGQRRNDHDSREETTSCRSGVAA